MEDSGAAGFGLKQCTSTFMYLGIQRKKSNFCMLQYIKESKEIQIYSLASFRDSLDI